MRRNNLDGHFRKAVIISDTLIRLVISTLLTLILGVVVIAAVLDKPNAMQILPIITGLLGTLAGYHIGRQENSGGTGAVAAI